jgi:hypothetical protein
MTELSPAALAVRDAAEKETDLDFRFAPAIAAAALEAVADQVVLFIDELHTDHMRKRNQLLAIAAELRGDTTTTQEDN